MHLELCWAPHKPERHVRHVCRATNSPHFQIGNSTVPGIDLIGSCIHWIMEETIVMTR